VVTYDPFRDFDRLAERMFSAASDMSAAARTMPIDLYRSGDHYVLQCDLPGADPGSVDVGLDGRVLTIRAARSPRTEEDVEWLTRERAVGAFARQITLGTGFDLGRIEATYADGVLMVTLPVAPEAQPRRIDVTFSGSKHSVPTESTKAVEAG
jgi:HSP20 family protein